MEHRDVFLIEQIVEYCDRIQSAINEFGDSLEAFENNPNFQDVCAFRIEHIGDFVNSLSDNFKRNHPEIEWHKIVGMRNILAHDYGSINNELLWKTIKKSIPELKTFCRKIIS